MLGSGCGSLGSAADGLSSLGPFGSCFPRFQRQMGHRISSRHPSRPENRRTHFISFPAISIYRNKQTRMIRTRQRSSPFDPPGTTNTENSKSPCTVTEVTDTLIKCNTTRTARPWGPRSAVPMNEQFEFMRDGLSRTFFSQASTQLPTGWEIQVFLSEDLSYYYRDNGESVVVFVKKKEE